ncbi:MAG TPA: hypothetical protein VME18_07550 [Acidobacteriaceae bacterium]|nr:hypothetical protein [Acidobacteriaceae bacterium]
MLALKGVVAPDVPEPPQEPVPPPRSVPVPLLLLVLLFFDKPQPPGNAGNNPQKRG